MYSKILVPYDGSVHAKNALTSAASLSSDRDARAHVTAVYIVHNTYLYAGVAAAAAAANVDLDELIDEEGQQLLQQTEVVLKEYPVTYDVRLIHGDPAHQVCKLAEDEGYDLIVMGSRGRGVMTGLALGSVSHKVIQRTQKPVLIIK